MHVRQASVVTKFKSKVCTLRFQELVIHKCQNLLKLQAVGDVST
jgi:hypothetical protein